MNPAEGQPGARWAQLLVLGAALCVSGIGFTLWVQGDLGAWLTFAGVASSIYAIHRLGRSGPI